jgi:hypothetical protein
MEQELDKCRADLRLERERRAAIGGHSTEADRDKVRGDTAPRQIETR